MSAGMKIADLNGPWALLFKIALLSVSMFVPAYLALNVWFVRSVMEIQRDLAVMKTRIQYGSEERLSLKSELREGLKELQTLIREKNKSDDK